MSTEPSMPNYLGQNAFDFAFFNNDPEIINLLIHRSIQPVLTEFQFQDYHQELPNENLVTRSEVFVGELRVNSNIALEQVIGPEILSQVEDQKEENLVVQSEVSLVQNSATPEVEKSEIPIATIAEKSEQVAAFSKNNPEAKNSWKQELRIR